MVSRTKYVGDGLGGFSDTPQPDCDVRAASNGKTLQNQSVHKPMSVGATEAMAVGMYPIVGPGSRRSRVQTPSQICTASVGVHVLQFSPVKQLETIEEISMDYGLADHE
ncbi:hypothetical protein BCR44DRAFT_1462803 [Catenaria anguillulae PL171]|uniref:Uncharacterized protein n=1 Tax=Catenaria anguillulae PL171 TaxID=765915 RepID=A0A1Y2HEA2_9FUNG|nr:hypothetical protein BCR44DRAFT_1462803 [Catenaria anguillulae PL171]